VVLILKAKYKIAQPSNVKLGAEFIYFKEVRLVELENKNKLWISLLQETDKS